MTPSESRKTAVWNTSPIISVGREWGPREAVLKAQAALMYWPFHFIKLGRHQPLFIVNELNECSATEAYLHYDGKSRVLCSVYCSETLGGTVLNGTNLATMLMLLEVEHYICEIVIVILTVLVDVQSRIETLKM